MSEAKNRWILAFDASCATCQEVSVAVAGACEGRVEVLPLAHQDVRRWRERCLGSASPSRPTLLRVRDGDEARAWTGAAMVPRLVRALGTRPTAQVLRALGVLRYEARSPLQEEVPGALGRKKFLRLGVTGAVVAGGILLTGRSPALAEERQRSAAAWAALRKGRLPEQYAEVISYSMPYRRAIYAAQSPQVRSSLWSEHLRRYRAAHPSLPAHQMTVFDRLSAFAADPANFAAPMTPDKHHRLEALRTATVAAFGSEQAAHIAATLGPATAPSSVTQAAAPRIVDCECSGSSDFCSWPGHGGGHCEQANPPCGLVILGCGWFNEYNCDGVCSG